MPKLNTKTSWKQHAPVVVMVIECVLDYMFVGANWTKCATRKEDIHDIRVWLQYLFSMEEQFTQRTHANERRRHERTRGPSPIITGCAWLRHIHKRSLRTLAKRTADKRRYVDWRVTERKFAWGALSASGTPVQGIIPMLDEELTRRRGRSSRVSHHSHRIIKSCDFVIWSCLIK